MPKVRTLITVLLGVGVLLMMFNLKAASLRRESLRKQLETRLQETTVDEVSVGVVSDLQYADRDDGYDYSGVHKRTFRRGLEVLRTSMEQWGLDPSIQYALNLGDLLDGWNHRAGQLATALVEVNTVMSTGGIKWIHNQGNHEFYNSQFAALQDLPKTTDLSDRWTIISLNSYAVSVLLPDQQSQRYQTARSLLMEKNPNLKQGNMTPGASVWLAGLEGLDKRYTPVNGGLGMGQLFWLSTQLRKARQEGRYVVIATHVPLHPIACQGEDLAWDYRQALNVISTEGRGVVALVLSGHDHQGGMSTLGNTPFITVPSQLENPSFVSVTISLKASLTRATVTLKGLLEGDGEYSIKREPAGPLLKDLPGGL